MPHYPSKYRYSYIQLHTQLNNSCIYIKQRTIANILVPHYPSKYRYSYIQLHTQLDNSCIYIKQRTIANILMPHYPSKYMLKYLDVYVCLHGILRICHFSLNFQLYLAISIINYYPVVLCSNWTFIRQSRGKCLSFSNWKHKKRCKYVFKFM